MDDYLKPSEPVSEASFFTDELFASEPPAGIVEHIWTLIRMASHYQARSLSEKLVQKLSDRVLQDTSPNMPLLRDLAHAHFVAGYSISINTYSYEAMLAIKHFHQMEELAHEIKDQTLLNLALTYQGDMYRRRVISRKPERTLKRARITRLRQIQPRGGIVYNCFAVFINKWAI